MAPEAPLKNGGVMPARMTALVQTACDLLREGAPKVKKDKLHRLNKADSLQGTISLRALADIGVPYAMCCMNDFLEDHLPGTVIR